jgi:hypothetical protein
MGIVRIDLRECFSHKPLRINESLVCVSDLFLRCLNDKQITNKFYINIYLLPKITKPDISISSKIIDLYISFDFDEYKTITSVSHKKEYLTSFILKSLIVISEFMRWSYDSFSEAFNKCKNLNFINEKYFKNKLYASPNKNYYFGLYMKYDIDKFEIFERLFDSEKKLLCERLCFVDRFKSFDLEWIRWSHDSTQIQYKYHGPSKIFETSIDNMLECQPISLPKTTSNYFK